MDILMEGRRRAADLARQRDAALAMSVCRYERVIFRASLRLAELKDPAGAAASEARRCEGLILQAQARIDEVLGLTYTPGRR